MHAEAYRVSDETAHLINARRRAGGRVWAVGTTVVRTLETVAAPDGTIRQGAGDTNLFIYSPTPSEPSIGCSRTFTCHARRC